MSWIEPCSRRIDSINRTAQCRASLSGQWRRGRIWNCSLVVLLLARRYRQGKTQKRVYFTSDKVYALNFRCVSGHIRCCGAADRVLAEPAPASTKPPSYLASGPAPQLTYG